MTQSAQPPKPQPFDPGPLAKVSVRPDGARTTLVFERHLRHPPAKVWAALTDPAQIKEWSPFAADHSLAALGPAVLTMTDGATVEASEAVVERADPPHLLRYRWGEDLLVWELAPDGTGTRLTLSHTVTERPWAPKVAAGWHICLAVAERLLDGNPIGPITGSNAKRHGWDQLYEAYGKVLGIRPGS